MKEKIIRVLAILAFILVGLGFGGNLVAGPAMYGLLDSMVLVGFAVAVGAGLMDLFITR